MTSPIKPPSGHLPLPPAEEVTAAIEGQEPASGLGKVSEVSREVGVAESKAVEPTAVDRIIGDLKSGAIDMETALNQLVEGAMRRSAAMEGAPAAMRKDLEILLRGALKQDPALAALLKDIKSLSQ